MSAFRRFVLPASLLACVSLSAQQGPAETAVPQLIRNFFAAEQAYDVPALSKLISSNYIEISPLGEVDRHDRFLGFYTPDKKKAWPPVTISDEEVRSFGDTAVEIATQSYSMTGPDGQPLTRSFRCTLIAHREAGTWKLVSAHFTGVRPPAPPKP